MDALPPSFTQVQESLEPYIKSRQELRDIRRSLAAHAYSQLEGQSAARRCSPLALQDSSVDFKSTPDTMEGPWKEYLKCLKDNDEARREYNALRRQHRASHDVSEAQSVARLGAAPTASVEDLAHLRAHDLLVKQRQRLERLRILQNYIDGLTQRAVKVKSHEASTSSHDMPRLPAEVVAGIDTDSQETANAKVEGLVLDLKKEILKAKANLTNERHILSRAQAARVSREDADADQLSGKRRKLHALSKTRDELISWVEGELGIAGEEDPAQDADEERFSPERDTEDELELVKEKYAQYLAARKSFLLAVAEQGNPHVVPYEHNEENNLSHDHKRSTTPLTLPFLEEIHKITCDQKSLIQQRAHLTTSLAKQYNLATQTFDRLADESHMLPAFPLPTPRSPRRASEMSSKVFPTVLDRAEAWTYAAGSSATDTKNTVLENIESGFTAIEEAREAISRIERMLGHDEDAHEKEVDVWRLIDGQIGLLGRDEE
ncbi:MAG: hypothetical protein M1818_001534 [Claussenomyces sp. TS43310]|nr:MAG: hypothetical protein M1818_001534 [Claussenomyces sp. TS43310]